jgi:hypothetical protein
MNMLLIEFLIIAGVLIYVAGHTIKEQKPTLFLKQFLFTAVAAWMAEESSIRFYGTYAYSSVWNLIIVDVPLVVIVVWPALVHSAIALSSFFSTPNSCYVHLLAGGIVLTDAMLIEPISAGFNLWQWHQPGLFGVPIIGILGWAYFTFFSTGFFSPLNLPGGIKLNSPLMLVLAVIGTHLFLLVSYWAFFKWMITPINPILSAVVVWIGSAILFFLFAFTNIGDRVVLKPLLIRIPAAIFFFALLFVGKNPLPLIIYCLAFIPPYIAMMVRTDFFSGLFNPRKRSAPQN